MFSDEVEVAWAAGFWEGEGSVRCALTRNRSKVGVVYAHLCVTATQRDREPLDRLVAILGGGVYGPYVYGDYDPPRTHYNWTIWGKKAEAAIARIEPHLTRRRKEQIQRARDKILVVRGTDPKSQTALAV